MTSAAKLMVSPADAAASAARSEPAPLSLLFVTVMVAMFVPLGRAAPKSRYAGARHSHKFTGIRRARQNGAVERAAHFDSVRSAMRCGGMNVKA